MRLCGKIKAIRTAYVVGERGASVKKKRCLIVTASIGSGHIKAAEALKKSFAVEDPEMDVSVVDFMTRDIAWKNWFMKSFYLHALSIVPNLYEFFYKLAGGRRGGTGCQKAFAHVMEKSMQLLADEYKPDIVVCTHPFPEAAAALMKKQHKADFLLATVMTDYCVHQIWLYPEVDQNFFATEEMRREMMAYGFEPSRLHPFGIPISMEVSGAMPYPVEEIGARKDAKIILVMGGGLGLGGIGEALRDLDALQNDFEIIVVAGRNETVFEDALKYSGNSVHKVHVIGYTGRIPELMKASTLLVSKPGALTISEAFAAGLPMLLHGPIPGPEIENAIYAAETGAALWVKKRADIAKAAGRLLDEPKRIAAMRRCAEMCSKPDAASYIAKALCKAL